MITVKDLVYRYPGQDKPVLKSISFDIHEGEIFGFLGPSGAGKSTTQKILIGLLKDYQGTASIFKKDLAKFSSDLYEDIGVAFEFPNFYQKFTALENLRLYQKFYSGPTADPEVLLSMVGLLDDRNTKVSDFSKGMKMRLNFCRALLNRPKILFLDEPSSGLDPVNAKVIRSLILDLKKEGTTIIITTHNMNLAADICDRVAFIVDGNIPLIDSPKALMLEKGEKFVTIQWKMGEKAGKNTLPLSKLHQNPDFIHWSQSGAIEMMHTKEATLEDIFIEVTGRGLQ
jgi:fluoroquinolone transport system ATP-binding protein